MSQEGFEKALRKKAMAFVRWVDSLGVDLGLIYPGKFTPKVFPHWWTSKPEIVFLGPERFCKTTKREIKRLEDEILKILIWPAFVPREDLWNRSEN